MNRSIQRVLITCLLLVALPSKAFAAASVLVCGPNHHGMYGTVIHDVEPTGPSWHDHGDGVSQQHPELRSPAYDPEQSILASHETASATVIPHFSAKFECGTCAPCCAGAVLIGDVSIHVAAQIAGADFPISATVHRSAPVGRLDRPPRLILA